MAASTVLENRVVRLIEPGKVELFDAPLQIGPRDVAIKVAACGICAWEAGFYTGQRETVLPRTIGHEPAGVVAAVGSEVREWQPGDRVAGLVEADTGGFATFARAVPDKLVRIPDHLPMDLAIVEPVKCIVTGLRAAHPEFGDHAMVVGCGFMGLLCVAGLRSAGLASLIAVDLVDARLKVAKQIGATHCLNPARDDVPGAIADITGRHGIDVAMEASTVPAGFDLASQVLRRGRARLVVVTTALPGATYNVEGCLQTGASVHFAEPGYCLDLADELRRAMDAMGRGVFPMQQLITHRFGQHEIGRAMETCVARTPGYIKGVVIP